MYDQKLQKPIKNRIFLIGSAILHIFTEVE